MPAWPFEEIKALFKSEKVLGNQSRVFSSYSIDSRTLKPGDLFFALKGERFDGHNFIEEVLRRGAGGVVCSDSVSFSLSLDQAAFFVKDTCVAFQEFARYHRMKQPARVVAVTGSNGKTTTKEWIAQLCSLNGSVHKTEGNKNNHIGVPLTLLGLHANHRVAVIEMGMNALGEIDRLAELAHPNIGVITSVGSTHLEKLHSIENVFKGKKELVDRVSQWGGVLFLNGDDPRVLRMAAEANCPVFTYGTNEQFDYVAKNIRPSSKKGTLFDLEVPLQPFRATVRLPHLGHHNVLNCLAAIAVSHSLGGKLSQLVAACENLTAPAMRLEWIEKEGIIFINDAYNANPTSMEVALNVLDELETEGKKIFVCGDMLELGMVAELAHQQLGEKIYDSKIDVLITYGHLSQATAQRAIECGMDEKDVFVCYEKKAIPNIIKDVAAPGDVVLLKGSRRNQLEKVLEDWRTKSETEVVSG